MLYLFWLGAFHTSLCAGRGGQPLDIDQDLLNAIRIVESGGDNCEIGTSTCKIKVMDLIKFVCLIIWMHLNSIQT